MFEQYLREQFEKVVNDTNANTPWTLDSYDEWRECLTKLQLINYGNKAMEELSNGMNLEIIEG